MDTSRRSQKVILFFVLDSQSPEIPDCAARNALNLDVVRPDDSRICFMQNSLRQRQTGCILSNHIRNGDLLRITSSLFSNSYVTKWSLPSHLLVWQLKSLLLQVLFMLPLYQRKSTKVFPKTRGLNVWNQHNMFTTLLCKVALSFLPSYFS